jgi:hypothetical protein
VSQASSIRDGIVANLQPLLVSNGGVLGQITPYPQSSMSPPCAQVQDGQVVYDRAMRRGLDEQSYMVAVYLPFTSDTSSQKLMDELRDGKGVLSVKTLVESDRTLGGACQDSHVALLTESRLYDRQQGGVVLGCEWQLAIYL